MESRNAKLTAPKVAQPPGSAVVLVIDAQVDFLSPTAALRCINADKVVENIRRVIVIARKANLPVIYTREAHNSNGLDYGLELESGAPFHCVEGTPGIEIVPELKPLPGEFVIDKRRYNAFLGTNLDQILDRFGHPTLYITGFTTNVCIHYTAIEAWQRDYPVRVISDCVSGTSDERHQMALKMLDFISRRIVINLDEFLISFGQA